MHVASNIILSEVEPAILFQHVLSTDGTLHEIEIEFEIEFEFVLKNIFNILNVVIIKYRSLSKLRRLKQLNTNFKQMIWHKALNHKALGNFDAVLHASKPAIKCFLLPSTEFIPHFILFLDYS